MFNSLLMSWNRVCTVVILLFPRGRRRSLQKFCCPQNVLTAKLKQGFGPLSQQKSVHYRFKVTKGSLEHSTKYICHFVKDLRLTNAVNLLKLSELLGLCRKTQQTEEWKKTRQDLNWMSVCSVLCSSNKHTRKRWSRESNESWRRAQLWPR